MAVPRTYLFIAPQGAPDPVGRSIMFHEIVAGLKLINPNVSVWEQYPDGLWYPGKQQGKTCLWIGEPGGESKKISAILPGPVPEFTQVGVDGRILMKGWRSIFEKAIKAGAATREQIEKHFKVDLTVWGEDLLCKPCARAGKRRTHNRGARKLCNYHENITRMAEEIVAERQELLLQQEASQGVNDQV